MSMQSRNSQRFLALAFSFFLFASLASAQYEKIGITLEAGINNSDMQYGSELVEKLMPTDDYTSFMTGGDAGRAYTFSLGTEIPVYKNLYALARVNYTVFRYKVEGNVRNPVTPQSRPDIVIAADGDLDYSFIELSAGISYHLNNNPKTGLFGTLYMSHLIDLQRNWDLDAQFENDLEGNVSGEPPFDDIDFNNLWMVGAEIGVRLPLSSKVTIAPKFGFQLGLNPVVDDTITPTASTGAIQLSTWF